MSASNTPIPVPTLPRLLVLPALIGLFTALLSLVWSVDAAYSAAIGAITALLPTMYFAFKLFRYRGASKANLIVHEFYRAESGKFVLTAVMFAVTFATYKQVVTGAMFVGFIVTTIAIWIAAHRALKR
jgi:ATP synthase protein I